MAENNEETKPSEGFSGEIANEFKPVRVSCLIFPWVLLLLLAVVFQAQFVLLQKELAAIKLQLSAVGNSTVEEERSLSKRSVSGNGKDVGKKISGIEAAHLHGTFPFQKIEKDGRIGPWSLSSPRNAFAALKSQNTELELTSRGLYHVYAQIYYLTSHPSNTYQLLTYNGTEERKHHRVLSTCAGQGRNIVGEVSCYTSFTGIFNKGTRLYLHQIEQNRIINNSNGCSFFGAVLLRKISNSRRDHDSKDGGCLK